MSKPLILIALFLFIAVSLWFRYMILVEDNKYLEPDNGAPIYYPSGDLYTELC